MIHGRYATYVKQRCRCDLCRAASAEYRRIRRRQAMLPDGDPAHGTVNGYINYECRCAACSSAHRDYYRP